jgi:O-antigen/teichoic acid export membrane protein
LKLLKAKRITPIALIFISLMSVLVQVSLNYILSKHSTVETFGEYRTFLALVSFSGIFHFGLIDGMYLRWLLNNEKPRTNEFASLIVIQVLVLGFLAFFFQKTSLIVPIFIQIFIQNLLAFSNNVLLREQKFIINSLIVLVNQLLLTFLVFIFSDRLTINFIVFLYNTLFICSTTILLVSLFLKKYIVLDGFWQSIKRDEFISFLKANLRIGFPILLTGLVFVGFQNLDKVILSLYYSKYEFGLYSFGYTIVNIVVGVVLSVTNFMLRKFIEIPLEALAFLFTKLTIGLTVVSILFVLFSPILFQIIQIFIPQYFAAKPYVLALSSIILPYVLLQLLIFNLFKIQNSSRIFFYNSLIHLFLLIAALFISVMLMIKLELVPFVILTIFFSWYLSSEYLLLKGNNVFKKGIKYRSLAVVSTILVNILYVTFS